LANHKSAEKRARVSIRRNAINSKTLSGVRTLEKKLRKTITAKQKDEATKILREFSSTIAKAAQKGRLTSRTASRKVSRLSRQVSALG
jgi:small subunit ribosomal protein S20